MNSKNVVILGSTGSIGTQSIDVIKTVGDKKIVGLSCDKNIVKLLKQVKETKCKIVAIYNKEKAEEFKTLTKEEQISISQKEYLEDIVIHSISSLLSSEQNELKSCSPIKYEAASRINATSSFTYV